MIWVSRNILKDITSPPTILSIIWSIMYFILIICTYKYDSSNFYFILFLISNTLFLIGFIIPLNGCTKISYLNNYELNNSLSVKAYFIKLLFLYIHLEV